MSNENNPLRGSRFQPKPVDENDKSQKNTPPPANYLSAHAKEDASHVTQSIHERAQEILQRETNATSTNTPSAPRPFTPTTPTTPTTKAPTSTTHASATTTVASTLSALQALREKNKNNSTGTVFQSSPKQTSSFIKPQPQRPPFTSSNAVDTANTRQLSFKERFEELNRKQEEKRASLATTQAPITGAKPLFSSSTLRPPPVSTEKKSSIFTSAVAKPQNPNAFGQSASKQDFKITDEEFLLLRDFLYEQCGIFVAENRKYLMDNRLVSRLQALGLHNFSEYHNYLRFDKNRLEELNKLFENMTTNETSFFRNNPQLDIFRDNVLTRVIQEQRAKGDKTINIWSAGCSSGEEPYTIGIILHELLGAEINNWRIKITANDLSLAILEAARKGLYTEYVMRTTPLPMLQKYFTKEDKFYKILPKVQKLVEFSQINLANKAQLAKVPQSHIIFCRNVIIYFDNEMKKHVINTFYDNLLPGGSLLIGHAESLHNISRAFKPEHYTGGIVYYKQN